MIALFFALPNLSVKSIESDEFRNLISVACPGDVVGSQRTVVCRILELFKSSHGLVTTRLRAIRSFSLALDIWTAPVMSKSYIALTAHFYDEEDEQLRRALINIRAFKHLHMGGQIRLWVSRVLEDFRLSEEKVVRYLTDNGTNVVSAFATTLYRLSSRETYLTQYWLDDQCIWSIVILKRHSMKKRRRKKNLSR